MTSRERIAVLGAGQMGNGIAHVFAQAGHPVTMIDISGEYSGMSGPMTGEKTVKPGYRLLGAIVDGPGGNVFLKFTGPAKTIAANQQKFEQLLASFDKEQK